MDDFNFENLNDEDIKELMALGIIPDQMSGLQDQMSIAQKLRDKGPPTGTDTGRVYVAASPLEHAAYAMQGIKAGRDIDKARSQQQALLAQQVRGRSKYFGKMMDTSERRASKPFMQGVEVDPNLVPMPQGNY